MEKEPLKREIIRNIIWNTSFMFLNRLGALIFTIIIARFLMPELFGVYSLATTIALIFITFADLGINRTMMRYVSSEIEKNKKKAMAYFRYTLKLKLILSFFLSFLLIILAYPFAFFIFKNQQLFSLLLLLSIYTFLLALESFYEFIFYIKKRVNYLTTKEAIFQSTRILIALFVFLFLAASFYLFGVIISLILAVLFSFLFILYKIKKIEPAFFKKTKEKINKKRVLKFLSFLTIGSLSTVFFSYTDIVMLGIFLPEIYVGYYKVAFTLIVSIASFLAFQKILLPVFTQARKGKIEEIFNKSLKYVLALTIPSSFGIIILAKYLVRFLFGYEYLPATLPLFFLSFLIILFTTTTLFFILSSAREKPKEFAKFILIVTFLNIFLNYLFIVILMKKSYLWATTGAAIATLISQVIYFVLVFIFSKKELNIKADWKLIIKPLFASLVMAYLLYGFDYFIHDFNLFIGILIVLFGILIYVAVMILIKGIDIKDFKVLKSAFNEKLLGIYR